MKSLLLSILTLTLSTPVLAQASKEFALMARVSWSAFECSALADAMKDEKESRRLFTLGYQQGIEFIDALRGNKIKRSDIDAYVPWGFLLVFEGPSADFVMGRVWEASVQNALKDVNENLNQSGSHDLRKMLAQNKFIKLNCGILRPVR